jgi:hypothetical protein
MASDHWESHPVPMGYRPILAYVINGKCIWMILEFEGPTYVDPMWPVGLPPAPCPWGLSTLFAQ